MMTTIKTQIIIMAINLHNDGFDDRQHQLRCDGNDAQYYWSAGL